MDINKYEAINAFSVFSFLKISRLPNRGPSIHPMTLKVYERLLRLAANLGSPNTVVYGLATVSKKVSPEKIMSRPNKNAQN